MRETARSYSPEGINRQSSLSFEQSGYNPFSFDEYGQSHSRPMSNPSDSQTFRTSQYIGSVLRDDPEIIDMSDDVEDNIDSCYVTDIFSSSDGVLGRIVKYLSRKIGVIRLVSVDQGDRSKLILFHTDQLWQKTSLGRDLRPFLEHCPLDEVESDFKVNGYIRFNAREVVCNLDFSLQATAVWGDKSRPPRYRTSNLQTQLDRAMSEIIYTLDPHPSNMYDPLLGMTETAVAGTVLEYITAEVGVVRLDPENTVSIFHLNQVWAPETTLSNTFVPFTLVQRSALPEYLPVGSSVYLAAKPVPCGDYSELKLQAVLLWKRLSDFQPLQTKPLFEFCSAYSSFEERMKLADDLERYYDQLKSLWNLYKAVSSRSLNVVPVILKYLPVGWQAVITVVVTHQTGIIEITGRNGTEISVNVRCIRALFHIEDLLYPNGVPAMRSPAVSMNQLINCHVDIIARSITNYNDPEEILRIQRKLNNTENVDNYVPVLQAIAVCVRQFPLSTVNSSQVPQPTRVRQDFSNFNQTAPECYLSPKLRMELDIKLANFLKRSFNPVVYKSLRSVEPGMIDEGELLKNVRKTNIQNSEKIIYGKYVKKSSLSATEHIYPTCLWNEDSRLETASSVPPVDLGCLENPRISTTIKHILAEKAEKAMENRNQDKEVESWKQEEIVEESEPQGIQLAGPEKESQEEPQTWKGIVEKLQVENMRQELQTSRQELQTRRQDPQTSRQEHLTSRQEHQTSRPEHQTSRPEERTERLSTKIDEVRRVQKPAAKMLPLPPEIVRVHKSITKVNESVVCLANDEITPYLENINGTVEKVLTDHLAVVSFEDPVRLEKRWALCCWQDVFVLDWSTEPRVKTVQQLVELTAEQGDKPLSELFRVGMRVKIDVIPMIPFTPNPSQIFHLVVGLIFGDYHDSDVPLRANYKDNMLEKKFKEFFGKTVLTLDKSLNVLPGEKLDKPTEKCGAEVRIEGNKILQLREGFYKISLPTPVMCRTVKVTLPTKIQEQVGVVIKIVNANYGIGCARIKAGAGFATFQFLFDTLDFIREDKQLSNPLEELVAPGHFIKFNAVKVAGADPRDRNLVYLATAVSTSASFLEVNGADFSEEPALDVE